MTTSLVSKYNQKIHIRQNPKKIELNIDDFISSLSNRKTILRNNLDNPKFVDFEFEVSGTPTTKNTRTVTFEVETKKKAKFEATPIEFYSDI
jgi:hypothetical protein